MNVGMSFEADKCRTNVMQRDMIGKYKLII
jgi:hypothetical protein